MLIPETALVQPRCGARSLPPARTSAPVRAALQPPPLRPAVSRAGRREGRGCPAGSYRRLCDSSGFSRPGLGTVLVLAPLPLAVPAASPAPRIPPARPPSPHRAAPRGGPGRRAGTAPAAPIGRQGGFAPPRPCRPMGERRRRQVTVFAPPPGPRARHCLSPHVRAARHVTGREPGPARPRPAPEVPLPPSPYRWFRGGESALPSLWWRWRRGADGRLADRAHSSPVTSRAGRRLPG